MSYRVSKVFFILALIVSVSGCSGGGSGSPSGGATPQNGGTPPSGTTGGNGTVKLSGQVAVSSSQLAAAGFKAAQISRARAASIQFATAANSVMPGASVTLVKVKADGTREAVSGMTTTTDDQGNYTLDNVPPAQTGSGDSTDFYYEVQATSGGLVVSAPAAPKADETVNVSPETKIAAAMVSDVASVPSVTAAAVLPSGKAIELLRSAVFANIQNMSTFTLPSMAAGDEGKVDIAATAISSDSGNSDKLMRAFNALKEGLYLRQNRAAVPEKSIAGYLRRFTASACDYQGNAVLPQMAADALAQAFKSGTTFTLQQIVDAFSQNGGPPATAEGVITAYYNSLNSLNTALTGTAGLPDGALLGAYISMGELSSLSTASTFEADQALALLQAMAPQSSWCLQPPNYIGAAADLTGNPALKTTPAFSDNDIYYQRLQCPNGGSLEARVKVFVPQGTDVSGVTIFAAGMKDQFNNAISGPLSLTADNFPAPGTSNWMLSGGATQACLAFGQTYTFTIAAGLSTGGTLTATVARTVVDVPEASITLMAKDYSEAPVALGGNNTGQPGSPIHIPTTLSSERPLFKWTPAPGDAQPIMTNAPAGSRIKYLFDVSHFAYTTGPGAIGGPENRDFVNCPVVQNPSGKFFEADYILSPIDCDVDKCDAALPDVPHVCRIHVQTVLVDEFGRTLGWSAGADLFYCIQGQSNCP